VLLWTFALYVAEHGDDGTLESKTLRRHVYPKLRGLAGTHTDIKFKARGSRPTKEKIVILEIDDRAVERVGRWPWHRDAIALLALTVFQHGAKAVGIDIVFPEDDVRVPPAVADLLKAKGMGDQIPTFETDLVLKRIIDLYKDKLVLGWMSDTTCRPRYQDDRTCDVTAKEALAKLPKDFDKFAFDKFDLPKDFDPKDTAIASAPTVVSNLPMYNASAVYSGFLVNAVEESDEVVRRAQAVIMVNGKPHASLPMQMAAIGLGDKLAIDFDGGGQVKKVSFVKTGREIPVSPTGAISINFRGRGYHFPYVSALDLFLEKPEIPVQQDGAIKTRKVAEVFKDAYVLIGVSAMGARDLRHFPFGNNIPGTEGLATILDNVLAGDAIKSKRGIWRPGLLFVLMTLGAGLFCFLMIRLSAIPALIVSLGTIGFIALFDIYYVFGARNVNLNTVFLLGQLTTIFVATLAVKYVVEERGKRMIRGTFSKYLAPEVVDEMLKDPDNIKLGGEARELTIMMSDLRGFTATAERLTAEQVLEMLNHYLGTMADIIVDYRGTIDEFIGDAILVIFGAPISRPDDATRAVACCIAMQKAMKSINEVNTSKGLPKLEMGIALNTGEVTVGNIGSQKRLKYGIVGSHVNLTARIESNTVGGQLLVSERTLELAGDTVKVGEKFSIIAKGFPDPIVAYEVLGIAGEYNLYLDEVDLALVDLSPALDVRYRVMKSKNDEGPEQTGQLSSLSELGAMLETEDALEVRQNLKLFVSTRDGKTIEGDLYAKVMASGTSCTLRFTAVPPEVEAFIGTLTSGKGEEDPADDDADEKDDAVKDDDSAKEDTAAKEDAAPKEEDDSAQDADEDDDDDEKDELA